jgi:hypothetical protein
MIISNRDRDGGRMFFVTCVFFAVANQNLHESRLKSAPTRMNQMDASRIGSSWLG